jgi:hypothetical protein
VVKTTGEVVTATGRAKVERIAAAEIPIRRRGGVSPVGPVAKGVPVVGIERGPHRRNGRARSGVDAGVPAAQALR